MGRFAILGLGALLAACFPARSLLYELSNWEALESALRAFDLLFAAAAAALALGGVGILVAGRFLSAALWTAGGGGVLMGAAQAFGQLLGVVPCPTGG